MKPYQSAKERWINIWMKEHEKYVYKVFYFEEILYFCALLLSTSNECSSLLYRLYFSTFNAVKLQNFTIIIYNHWLLWNVMFWRRAVNFSKNGK